MGTFLIFFTALLLCALLIGWWYRAHARRRRLPLLHAFSDAATRKLSAEERRAVEKYLEGLSQAQKIPATGASVAPVSLTLNAQSETVITVTRAITRYGITTDDPNKWRYFLDSVEVHLPPFWEQHINDENSVDLIPTDSLPLVIALNGHALSDYPQEARGYALERASATQASIRGEESEQVELLNIRQETAEEHALSRPDGLREAVLIVAAFLLFYFSLISPYVFTPWLLGGGLLLLLAGLWECMLRRVKTRCGRSTACGECQNAGVCLVKTIRSTSIISPGDHRPDLSPPLAALDYPGSRPANGCRYLPQPSCRAPGTLPVATR